MGKNKNLGYVLLAIGVALMLLTFFLAFNAFRNPESLEEFAELVPGTTNGEDLAEATAQLVSVLIYIVAALLLWVMGSIGGKVLKYSIKLVRSPGDTPRARTSQRSSKKKSQSRKRSQPQQPQQQPPQPQPQQPQQQPPQPQQQQSQEQPPQ